MQPGQTSTLARRSFREFVDEEIAPHAGRWDREGAIPREIVAALAGRGYLAAGLRDGGGRRAIDMVRFGVLHEEVGRGCSSVRSLLTVHGMVAHSVRRWGSPAQNERWLPALAAGGAVGAFALTEEGSGSDARDVRTRVTRDGSGYVLDGGKRWITMGAVADVFLVFARDERGMSAFLVERDSPGLDVQPTPPPTGTRASRLAQLSFDGCRVPADAALGPRGLALGTVLSAALDIGRYSVACGCVGIAQACLEASLDFSRGRHASGLPIRQHQLIREMIANMATDVRAARLLCQQAGLLKDEGDPATVAATWEAKYFASRAAARAASDAVQIHGARGCSTDYPVERYLRDAKVMEIIEGSTQIQQITIAELVYQEPATIVDLPFDPVLEEAMR
jgi:alkylation response protein AidB-like acyl-CoA dehydrogenase